MKSAVIKDFVVIEQFVGPVDPRDVHVVDPRHRLDRRLSDHDGPTTVPVV
jgi:hypothetical protein